MQSDLPFLKHPTLSPERMIITLGLSGGGGTWGNESMKSTMIRTSSHSSILSKENHTFNVKGKMLCHPIHQNNVLRRDTSVSIVQHVLHSLGFLFSLQAYQNPHTMPLPFHRDLGLWGAVEGAHSNHIIYY